MIELMILFSLLKRDLTMYGVHKFVLDNFSPFTRPSFGAIKPALVRLEKGGFITSRKLMSDGGKLSVFYSVTRSGLEELKLLLTEDLSVNPLQFLSNARVKLCCGAFLDKEEREKMFFNIKTLAMEHKTKAENIINDEYNTVSFYQRIVLDNIICEYNNFINLVEGFEKENAGNSK